MQSILYSFYFLSIVLAKFWNPTSLPWDIFHHPTSTAVGLTTIDSFFQPPLWGVIDFSFSFTPVCMFFRQWGALSYFFNQCGGVSTLRGCTGSASPGVEVTVAIQVQDQGCGSVFWRQTSVTTRWVSNLFLFYIPSEYMARMSKFFQTFEQVGTDGTASNLHFDITEFESW
jgi:hypothetical protein